MKPRIQGVSRYAAWCWEAASAAAPVRPARGKGEERATRVLLRASIPQGKLSLLSGKNPFSKRLDGKGKKIN